MGWQDRDWAKLTDAELESLYGVRRHPRGTQASRPAPVAAHRRAAALIGPVAATLLLLAAAGVVWAAGRGPSSPRLAAADAAYPVGVIFGIRGSAAGDPYAPGGSETVCTEGAEYLPSGAWRCLTWAVDTEGLPISSAQPYGAACGHGRVDESSGRWTCLQASPLRDVPAPAAPAAQT